MTGDARSYRLPAIDLVRGLVVVIMALDHVRDYVMVAAEVDPSVDPDVTATLFFTRWITHFCAPVFVFLAGTSAGLMAGRRTSASLGRFLLLRGLWLIAVEWVVVSTAWSFAPFGLPEVQGLVAIPLQVIWAIGASMVVLAGAQILGPRACLWVGVIIVAGHNLLDPVWPATGGLFDTSPAPWVSLHARMAVVLGPFFVVTVYPVLPWIGVMLAGFGTAGVFRLSAPQRDARLLIWGAAITAAFIVLRLTGGYGDPDSWQTGATVVRTTIDFLNVTKYPPSLLFVLMTLGPTAILCAWADRVPTVVARPLQVFGRVPFAFYVAHLYLIHAIGVAIGVTQGFSARDFLTFSFFFPEGYGLSLPATYVVWMLVVAALYPGCRWMAGLKSRRRDWWLSYL